MLLGCPLSSKVFFGYYKFKTEPNKGNNSKTKKLKICLKEFKKKTNNIFSVSQ